MRNRARIGNTGNIKTRTLEGTNGCFTTAARTFNINSHLPQAVLHSFPCRVVSCQLSSIRSTLTRPFEPCRSRASPGNYVSLGVGKSDYGIIKRGIDVSSPAGDRLTFPPSGSGSSSCCHLFLLCALTLLLGYAASLAPAGNRLSAAAPRTGICTRILPSDG
jgi:hypothetical protein